MPNRNQDHRSGRSGRERLDEGRHPRAEDERDYGSYVESDEGDSSVRAGSYDQGRMQGGQNEQGQFRSRDPYGSRDTGERDRERYAGYGDFGRGDYGGGREGNSGEAGFEQDGWGRGRRAGSGYSGRSGNEPGLGGERNYGAGTGRGFSGYGYEASGSRGIQREGGQQSGYGQSGYGQSNYEPGQYGGASSYGTPSGLHRGKGPKGYQRSDERLKEMICERLREDPDIDPSEVTITVQGGRVTLEGTVDSRHCKNAIEDVAEQFGVQEVQNNLRVQRASQAGVTLRSAGKSGNEESQKNRH